MEKIKNIIFDERETSSFQEYSKNMLKKYGGLFLIYFVCTIAIYILSYDSDLKYPGFILASFTLLMSILSLFVLFNNRGILIDEHGIHFHSRILKKYILFENIEKVYTKYIKNSSKKSDLLLGIKHENNIDLLYCHTLANKKLIIDQLKSKVIIDDSEKHL
jgi:hypothetical protein